MLPARETRLDRIRCCITDLSDNGIQLSGADERRLSQVIRQHLDYFQLMLGYDSDPAEVMMLIKQRMAQA